MTEFKYEEEATWKLTRELAWEVYGITSYQTFGGDRRVKDAIRRASFAIMANVAEGFERSESEDEFNRYLARAKNEITALSVQLASALEQNYIETDVVKRLEGLMGDLGFIISGIMTSLGDVDFSVSSMSGGYRGL